VIIGVWTASSLTTNDLSPLSAPAPQVLFGSTDRRCVFPPSIRVSYLFHTCIKQRMFVCLYP
jgi:hypothetical protein